MTDNNTTCPSVEIHEQTEEASVTREAFLARAFMEEFSERFTEAELTGDQAFVISAPYEFDKWLVKMALLPPAADDNEQIVMRGRNILRQEVRKIINRGAEFGKTIWPPFSIQINKKGVSYEVRLMNKHLEKMPTDLALKTKTYLTNHLSHWSRISNLMHTENVRKYAPEQFMAFVGIERMVDMTMKNMVSVLGNLNEEMIAAARDTHQFLARLPDTEPKRLRHYTTEETDQLVE